MSRVLSFFIEETGVVKDFAGSVAPAGYLMCYGQAVSRTAYAALFDVIGTAFGTGDGSTTFNVPDARGRTSAGKDNMGGTAASRLTTAAGGVNGATLGAAGGGQTHTLTQAQLPAVAPTFTGTELPAHGHPLRAFHSSVGSPSGSGGVTFNTTTTTDPAFTGVPSSTNGEALGGQSAGTPAGTISNLGSGEAHPIVQPTIVFNKIIKT